MDRIETLRDTLKVMEIGYYFKNGRKVPLRYGRDVHSESIVILPDEIERIKKAKIDGITVMGRCHYVCENTDSFSMAVKLSESERTGSRGKKEEVLVLNFANPVRPGGGVRDGDRAQEGDLCICSTLLASLESDGAAPYYEHLAKLDYCTGSDAVIITPHVEILKDRNGKMLDEPVTVAVISCAAPMYFAVFRGTDEDEYRKMFYGRIEGILKCAAYYGYSRLVLGAFGCGGTFGTDAAVVSDMFYKAFKEFEYCGRSEKDYFDSVAFAVLDRSDRQYNFREFSRNFSHFYREEDRAAYLEAEERIKDREEKYLDKIRGCIFGGAAGDALGYPVEFMTHEMIVSRFGADGITSYSPRRDGLAEISDDTQMSLFTACGVMVGDTRFSLRGIGAEPSAYVSMAYDDWYATQTERYKDVKERERGYLKGSVSWLTDVPELFSRRAPGNTCMSALDAARRRTGRKDFIGQRRNDSKGCGGIMRIAPFALYYDMPDIERTDMEAAQIAAITHGNSLGYMPAAFLAHILNRLLYSKEDLGLKEVVAEAGDTVRKLFKDDSHIDELTDIVDLAVELSENGDSDVSNIRKLGEGWVAEETLAIAVYCALRYENDFSRGIAAAVNHDGDSDSTGAVTGNILGLINGFSGIADKWKKGLELSDVILEIADDVCHRCQMTEYSAYYDPAWVLKYIYARRYRGDE